MPGDQAGEEVGAVPADVRHVVPCWAEVGKRLDLVIASVLTEVAAQLPARLRVDEVEGHLSERRLAGSFGAGEAQDRAGKAIQQHGGKPSANQRPPLIVGFQPHPAAQVVQRAAGDRGGQRKTGAGTPEHDVVGGRILQLYGDDELVVVGDAGLTMQLALFDVRGA